MIVKFDHISYSCAYAEEEQTKALFPGYQEAFAEKDLENLSIKAEFLKEPAKLHNITMLQADGGYPIEITAYPSCFQGAERYELQEQLIRIFTPDVEATADFYAKLGFRQEDADLVMKPMLDQREVRLRPEEASDREKTCYLDQQGYGSLAFVVDNGARQKKQLDGLGIYTTEIQELMVNGKLLKIFFAKSSAGDLVEFIGVR